MYRSPELVVNVPYGVVTVTSAVPVPASAVAVLCMSESTVKLAAAVPRSGVSRCPICLTNRDICPSGEDRSQTARPDAEAAAHPPPSDGLRTDGTGASGRNADAVEARRETIVAEVAQIVRESLEKLPLTGPGALDMDAIEVAVRQELRLVGALNCGETSGIAWECEQRLPTRSADDGVPVMIRVLLGGSTALRPAAWITNANAA